MLAPLCTLLAEGLEPWEAELAQIRFPTNYLALNLAEGVPYLLRQWPSNHLVKALIIQPGATDELYFRPGETWKFSQPSCSWLEALRAFTNRQPLQVVFSPPFLLLKRPDDPIKAEVSGLNLRWTEWFAKPGLSVAHPVAIDQNWEHLQPALRRMLKVSCLPAPTSTAAAHFYRSFWSGWNLDRQEILAAICLATRTSAILEKRRIIFQFVPAIREPKGKTP